MGSRAFSHLFLSTRNSQHCGPTIKRPPFLNQARPWRAGRPVDTGRLQGTVHCRCQRSRVPLGTDPRPWPWCLSPVLFPCCAKRIFLKHRFWRTSKLPWCQQARSRVPLLPALSCFPGTPAAPLFLWVSARRGSGEALERTLASQSCGLGRTSPCLELFSVPIHLAAGITTP